MRLTKCDFCRYRTNTGCMVTPNSVYCKEAIEEYRQHIANKQHKPIKSIRKW